MSKHRSKSMPIIVTSWKL